VLEFNNLLQEQRFYPSDIVFDQDQDSTAFYIVKRGKVAIHVIIDIESENTLPADQNWKVIKTHKKCMYMVRTLGPGEMFGHEALLTHFRNVQKTGHGNHKIPVR
jgi:CRP-like cAMP-binding protein